MGPQQPSREEQAADPRYAYVVCFTCGVTYQRIDFYCALHAHSCPRPQAAV